MAALVIFVGCQTGMKPSTVAKVDPPKPQATAPDNAKASTASTQQQATKTADADLGTRKATDCVLPSRRQTSRDAARAIVEG